jgi:SSS family solute:Na+ symporter
MVHIFGLISNMSQYGSARDEHVARFGTISGAFTKRVVIIGWMMCGLIALAMFPGGLSDTENTWGVVAKSLLAPGLLGLMLSGMLLGHMPSVGSNAIAVAALIARNIYEPLVKNRSQKHYLKVGQILLVLTLAASVVASDLSSSVIKLYTTIITFDVFLGAAVLLIFFWRRLSVPAIWVSLILWVLAIGVAPSLVPGFQNLRRDPALLQMTKARTITASMSATSDDVAKGLASAAGQAIQKQLTIKPEAIFYEAIARKNPQDPSSPLEAVGRFQVEAYLLSLAGFPVRDFSHAGLSAARWGVDGVLPFLMLILFSYLLPGRKPTQEDQHRVDGFFAKLKTPVASTPDEDDRELALSYANPHRFDHQRLFPGSSWEFSKWKRVDYLGFSACWVLVGLIIALLCLVLKAGS